MYRSYKFILAIGFPLLHLVNYSYKLFTLSSKLFIFFCKLNIDFHFAINLLPSESTSDNVNSASSANDCAVFGN